MQKTKTIITINTRVQLYEAISRVFMQHEMGLETATEEEILANSFPRSFHLCRAVFEVDDSYYFIHVGLSLEELPEPEGALRVELSEEQAIALFLDCELELDRAGLMVHEGSCRNALWHDIRKLAKSRGIGFPANSPLLSMCPPKCVGDNPDSNWYGKWIISGLKPDYVASED